MSSYVKHKAISSINLQTIFTVKKLFRPFRKIYFVSHTLSYSLGKVFAVNS